VTRNELDRFIMTLASYQQTMNDLVQSNRELASEVVGLRIQVAKLEARLRMGEGDGRR
jgi:hypothetical protein